jgi:hypothetical protein
MLASHTAAPGVGTKLMPACWHPSPAAALLMPISCQERCLWAVLLWCCLQPTAHVAAGGQGGIVPRRPRLPSQPDAAPS